MEIEKFNVSDIEEVVSLFYDTVHHVNRKDYSTTALHAWAPADEQAEKLATWCESLRANIAYVAKSQGRIVGFADLSFLGHIDRLYVHKDFQRKGIATALVDALESEAKKWNLLTVDTDASITAKPFFIKRGYRVVRPQIVKRRGVELRNYKMIKEWKE
ncbi:GNAT family N-acetyltransferase [Gracilibacillus salinarum]|uniref:GNAT family N-acetyltransferase n=1 Tax=Gracilibacillus salinarum TaxID=2932255 RepID=A0ABY4GS09_9BACI|nr:GNAT family N-acetyltransferase [Gracilibacillus salinarum]UOQ87173.1 GNAT family N-acetyltransferase [Gracilibacillus salinarum]